MNQGSCESAGTSAPPRAFPAAKVELSLSEEGVAHVLDRPIEEHDYPRELWVDKEPELPNKALD